MSKKEAARALNASAIAGMNSTLNVFTFVLRKTFTGFTNATQVARRAGMLTPKGQQRSIDTVLGSLLTCVNKIHLSTDLEKTEAHAEKCTGLVELLYPEILRKRIGTGRGQVKGIKNPARAALTSLITLAYHYKQVSLLAQIAEKEYSAYRLLDNAIASLIKVYDAAMAFEKPLNMQLEYRPLRKYNNLLQITRHLKNFKQEIIAEFEENYVA